LEDLVDRPSLFSILSKGINISFKNHSREVVVANPSDWNLEPDRKCYKLPISMLVNGKVALDFFLVVIAPEDRYQMVRGVIGLEASTPKNEDKVLVATLLKTDA
jgi:hypothetical protein